LVVMDKARKIYILSLDGKIIVQEFELKPD
jgi:hypothetical protein